MSAPPGATPPSTSLFLVRHAEPHRSVRGRCCGRTDVPLSPGGRRQARALGGWFLRVRPDAVYASPRQRATETAQAIAAAASLPVVVAGALEEIDFGEFEGMRYDEIAAAWPRTYRHWMAGPARVRFPGGEAFADLKARVVPWIDDTRRRHQGQRVVVVTHGGPLRAALGSVLRIPDSAVFRVDHAYGAVTMVEWVAATPVVRFLNLSPARQAGGAPGSARPGPAPG